MSRVSNKPNALQSSATESTEAAKIPQTTVKKYIVQCRYHTNSSYAYRIYASSQQDAEYIARRKFEEERTRGCRLDAVTAVEVVNE